MHAVRRTDVRQRHNQGADKRYAVQVARGGKPVAGIQSGRISIIEEDVMHWHKANHIHKWFVDNVQDDDDCRTYDVSWEELEKLASICERVISSSELVEGELKTTISYHVGQPDGFSIREPEKLIRDPSVAVALLPRCSGFFYGSLEYDGNYLAEVQNTYNWIVRMLADREAGIESSISYSSSW